MFLKNSRNNSSTKLQKKFKNRKKQTGRLFNSDILFVLYLIYFDWL